MYKIILASSSPQRRLLLSFLNLKFQVLSVNSSEIFQKNLSINEQLMILAKNKARLSFNTHLIDQSDPLIIISADTIVETEDGIILGKPKDTSQAFEFLEKLSSKMHCVKTAVYFWDTLKQIEVFELCVTKVFFYPIEKKLIKKYIDKTNPLQRAGAYGIQDEGKYFVKKIDGSYTNIIGFPINLIKTTFQKYDWNITTK